MNTASHMDALLAEARALPGRIDEARKTMQALSLRRGTVLAELTAKGAPYYRRIPELAADLGVTRGVIDEALAAHRKAAEPGDDDPVAYTRARTTSAATHALLDEVERGRQRRDERTGGR